MDLNINDKIKPLAVNCFISIHLVGIEELGHAMADIRRLHEAHGQTQRNKFDRLYVCNTRR